MNRADVFGLPATRPEIPVARFTGKTAKVPRCESWSIDRLQAELTRVRIREEKDGPLWSPVVYGAVKQRSNDAVESIAAAVLDFDEGHDWADFEALWGRWAYAIHTTYSHTPEHPKWRAVFPLREPVPAAEWPAVWATLAVHLGAGVIDPACKDVSRMYYLPACPAELEAAFYCNWHEGELLDPLEFPPVPIDPDPEPVERERAELNGKGRPGDDFDERATWDEILLPHGWKRGKTYAGGMTLWTRPGKKAKDGVSARTGPGKAGDRFYCWSSAAGVPHGKLLTKFSLYAFLEHGGDYSAAASALRKGGYGGKEDRTPAPTDPPADPPAGGAAVKREEEPTGFEANEVATARRVVELYGQDFRYCATWKCWLNWDGRRWEKDETGGAVIFQLAMKAIDSIVTDAFKEEYKSFKSEMLEWAGKCQSHKRIRDIVSIVQKLPGVPITPEALDTHPWLFNVQNGTLDLKVGELRPHRRKDFLTQISPVAYDPDADCPRWIQFLGEVFDGDEQLQRYIWKAVGYSLTGVTREKCFFFLHGNKGDNGKSKFIETLLALVGGYGRTTTTETLMARKDAGATNDVAALKGARFVSAPETEDGRRLNEGLIKRLTGNDTITARFLFGEFFSFQPELHIWMSGNYRPRITGTDDAIWRRVILIPFHVVFGPDRRDDKLDEKLFAELPGILAWAVEGCRAWQSEGLHKVESIADALKEYRADEDVLGAFLCECTTNRDSAYVSCAKMYEAYKSWASRSGVNPVSSIRFGKSMAERGEGSIPNPLNKALGKVYSGRELLDQEGQEVVYRGSND